MRISRAGIEGERMWAAQKYIDIVRYQAEVSGRCTSFNIYIYIYIYIYILGGGGLFCARGWGF